VRGSTLPMSFIRTDGPQAHDQPVEGSCQQGEIRLGEFLSPPEHAGGDPQSGKKSMPEFPQRDRVGRIAITATEDTPTAQSARRPGIARPVARRLSAARRQTGRTVWVCLPPCGPEPSGGGPKRSRRQAAGRWSVLLLAPYEARQNAGLSDGIFVAALEVKKKIAGDTLWPNS
jgi:hypothetical protein